jgi:UDP-N-acetylmuramate dehydrogenase
VLKAVLGLEQSTPEECKARMSAFVEQRKRTQPTGASMGSMFKNPEGDYAGRLIEAVGLKGTQQGAAQISPLHANFFINLGDATAADVWDLIQLVRERVASQFDVWLDLEVELIGDWEPMDSNVFHTISGGQA